MPTFVCNMLAFSLGRVATCGSVMKAPPSRGQLNSCGKSCKRHSSKSLMLPERFGNDLIPAHAALNSRSSSDGFGCLKNFLKNSTGFALKFTAIFVCSMPSRNRKLNRSSLPKMLHAARNLLPLTCSKSSAGPPCLKFSLAISAISKCGSTSA